MQPTPAMNFYYLNKLMTDRKTVKIDPKLPTVALETILEYFNDQFTHQLRILG